MFLIGSDWQKYAFPFESHKFVPKFPGVERSIRQPAKAGRSPSEGRVTYGGRKLSLVDGGFTPPGNMAMFCWYFSNIENC